MPNSVSSSILSLWSGRQRQQLQQALLSWFAKNQRSLPWRRSYQPYQVWISEIMLQQTQMERGVQYFSRWLQRFPDVAAVAAADEKELFKYWEGLGYYSRVRHLHQAARKIIDEYGGELPRQIDDLCRLPGVGPYTAAAISSIAWQQDAPLVDANVARLFARLADIDQPVGQGEGRRMVEYLAASMLPPGQARAYNQALMELGALVCTPRQPACGNCPLAELCLARRRDTIAFRPLPKAAPASIRIDMATGLLMHKGRIFIQQRQKDDIWGGLWEFPGGRSEAGETAAETVRREYQEETGFMVTVTCHITQVRHSHTKYRVFLDCFLCQLESEPSPPTLTAAEDYHWVWPAELAEYAFPAGHRQFIAYVQKHRPELFV